MQANFIICDDDATTIDKVKNIIYYEMMKNNLDYKIFTFEDYDSDFMEIMSNPMTGKIYILDIEAPSRSGIDIARIIRQNDVNSVIIFLTGHEELGLSILKSELMFLSFINKLDDCDSKIKSAIKKSLKVLDLKNIVRFCDNGVHFSVDIDEILYVTRDSVERKSIITTIYTQFKTHKSLNYLNEEFGDKFVRTHKSCIVNTERVACVSKKMIKFNNGDTIDLLSNKYKKELINRIK